MNYSQEYLEKRIKKRGRKIFAEIDRKKPSIFHKSRWFNRLISSCMKDKEFKQQLFRLLNALPYLKTNRELKIFTRICFARPQNSMPLLLKLGLVCASYNNFCAGLFRASIEKMAEQFIVGKNIYTANPRLKKLRQRGFAFTIDVLREATISKKEAREYQRANLILLDFLRKETKTWQPLGRTSAYLDWAYAPRINLSLKLSGLLHDIDPDKPGESSHKACKQLEPIVSLAQFIKAEVYIDMEEYKYKDITIATYKQMRRDWPNIGIAIQSYLRDTDKDLDDLLQWGQKNNLPIAVRLVKGAYWDHEIKAAKENGCQPPVYLRKPETDAAFERHIKKILVNHDICYLACASHNIRSIAVAIETAKILGVPENRYEFQVLYGMADAMLATIAKEAKRVRIYCPCGELLPGIAYLTRRLIENTANESILRQMFTEDTDTEKLLKNPLNY